jgi:DNA-binding CsgD family transcriptional regulator
MFAICGLSGSTIFFHVNDVFTVLTCNKEQYVLLEDGLRIETLAAF